MHDTQKMPAPDSPFLLERLMRQARRDLEGPQYASEQEFRAGLADLGGGDLHGKYQESLRDDPEEMAQELAFQAYESGEEEAARELVERALQIDPGCVDALTVRAFLTCGDAGDLVEQLEHAAACGENALGEEFFAEFMGDFWPMVEARPYLRCLKQLAEVLWNVGRRFDAVATYEDLLDLDPADHMGNSALLLGYYLSMGEIQRAWDLLEETDDEVSAVYSWAWVLLYLQTGDEEGARHALDDALDQNPYVAPLLIGLGDDKERDLPAVLAPGGEDEAYYCILVLGEAWERAGEAQLWLYEVLQDMGLIDADDEDPKDGDPASMN
jgi:tetratricopeptide (TPR) repeat protein